MNLINKRKNLFDYSCNNIYAFLYNAYLIVINIIVVNDNVKEKLTILIRCSEQLKMIKSTM
jgi:hypothetical protein